MSATVIKVENLSKQYRIGSRESYKTFREALANIAKIPLQKLLMTQQKKAVTHSQSNTIWALRDVSFEVKHGEVLGIIGRNGAGKTTLLKILSKITDPTRGRIELIGRVGSLLEVGIGFHPELSGHENIYLYGAILGMNRYEVTRKFDEIVAFAQLEKFIDTPVKRYSSGMYMRLAFAVAAHLESEILLVDEVLAVGDAAFQKKCIGKMGDVSKEGRTVLFVSHNMTAVKTLCSKALCLNSGCLEDRGPSNKVVSNYLRTISDSVLEKRWESPKTAPGNDQVRLLNINISASKDLHSDQITVDAPIQIEIKFYNFVQSANLNFSLVLYTSEDICVLNSVSKPQVFSTGIVRGVCHIPGRLLNASAYRIRLLIVKDASTPLLDEDHLLIFDVHDIEREAHWYGEWIGAVRPDLKWTIETFESDYNY